MPDDTRSPYFDLTPSLCFAVDGDGHIREANGAARGTLGFDPAQLEGRSILTLVHEEDRAAVEAIVRSDLGAHSVREIDVRMLTRVGGSRWFRWTAGRQGSTHLFVVATDLCHGLPPAAWPHHVNDPFSLLIESMTDYAIYVIDEHGFVSSWNSGARRIKGYDASDILGKPYAIFYTPEDQAAGLPQDHLAEAAERGRVESEGWRVRKDGTRFWASTVLTALRDPEGRIVGYGKVTRDLTERRAAEQRLRASEERLRLLVESATDYAIFMIDPVGRVVSWNRGAQNIKGYRADEILGQHFSVFYPPEDIATRKPTRALETALATGRFEDEAWRMRKDGTRFWASVVISPLRTPSGELVGFGKVTRDLSARRKAEEALRQSEERFRLLVETVQDYAIFMLDPEGRVQSWNRGAEALKGYTAAEIIGSHFSRFYPPEDIANRKPARELEIATKEGRVEDEGWRVRKDGSLFWANVVITRLVDEHGRLVGFAKVTRDLTQRREMEQAIRQSNVDLEARVAERTKRLDEAHEEKRKLEHQLQQSAKMEAIGRLAGGVAHDFNNMLTVIQGNLEVLMSGELPSDPQALREGLNEIKEAASRSAELTRQLLAFSRRQVLMPRAVDLNTVVTGMMPLILRLIGEGIRVETSLAPDLLRTMADPSQIEQVILNLVVNARDAMPDGGQLTIETLNTQLDEGYARAHSDVSPGSYVMLSISDSGSGMDDATRARVFEPFFTTKGPGRGTGLGLSTVHGIVRQSNGHVQVYSEPGHGTTFKVYLPSTSAPAEPAEVPAPAKTSSPSGAATVLLVEDEPRVRRLARSILTAAGYRVLEAQDGEHALELAGQSVHAIDVLVTDVVMPGMNGVQLYDALRVDRPGIKVLYMSGYTENAIVHQGVLDPGVNFLSKPFTRETLTAKLREVLGDPGVDFARAKP